MSFQCAVVVFLVGMTLGGVWSHPERPPLLDSGRARQLFNLVESHSASPGDGRLGKNEVDRVFEEFDLDGDGRVEPGEFGVEFERRGLGSRDRARLLFQRVDTDHDGVISRFPDIGRVFQFFDIDGDGAITEMEFVIIWSSMSS
ncbi:hypothetical protein ACOMHN_043240 [Nucella lapillus]